jgi:xanthine dehydrogenase iron-sulfur cluster and FAD-binding subunit A
MIAQYIVVGVVVAVAATFIIRKLVLTFTKKGCATGGCGCAATEISVLKQKH